MRSRKLARAAFAGVLVPPLFAVVAATPATAQPNGPLTATPLAPAERIEADKAPTSRLAQTDRTLLGRTDAEPVQVVLKLDYDSLATYTGTVRGYEATSPAVTGRALGRSAAEQRYAEYVAGREAQIVGEAKRRVPALKVHQSLRTVYGGVAATVPANQVDVLLAVPGVVAVQRDELRKPLTDSSASFIGATSVYPQLGGTADAGKGVIFGVLDTGAWPEHPSFADQGNLGAPPPKADGTPRECDFGDNPLTPEHDPFVCNNKLIGGAAFLDAYLSSPVRAGNEPFHTARDSNGHGTHTGSTAAGNVLESAKVFGVERGPLHGIAPGAWISVYKVCGIEGCFSSDSAAAVQQAILDGVKVINFSISGGTNPFTDPVELAFLDAYAAGVFVSASAGNNGPGAATVNHVSPWVTTVAASTQRREFSSTLTVTGANGATATFTGASITAGVGPLPVVMSSAAPYSDPLCENPAPAGLFTGKIVACERGVNARVDKGFNVLQGGAAGMILFNPALADIETDNHWLPTVHLADGTDFVAFMQANPQATAEFTAGQAGDGQGDVMAAFSSRGPGGHVLKPDITAPGVQILAGHTPVPEASTGGPPGEYFQAIAGTSMSAPHIAGSALLLKALHPNWTPGQIKSAMMTTAITDGVVKEDTTTPATPLDYGAGRVDLTVADTPGLTFDESAARMAALGNDPVNAVHLNVPSVNAPVMPGRLTTVRKATNVTGKAQVYRVTTSAPAGSSIDVTPRIFGLAPGKSIDLRITITSKAPTAQYFGEIRLDPQRPGLPTLHLPVAFVPRQGAVNVTSECAPATVGLLGASTCTVTATNNSFGETVVDLTTRTDLNLLITGANGATVKGLKAERKGVTLSGAQPGVPSIAPGTIAGAYLPLAGFGIAPTAIGDETIVNYNVPPFVYAGQTFTRIGVDSNGYIVVGGATAEDNNCCNLTQIPDPARPNNVLAPFWTDLDGTGADGLRVASLTDGVNTWIVVEWNVNVWGTTSNRHFQVWIGLDGTEDIVFAYDPAALPADPGMPFLVGAENINGTGGQQLPPGVLPTQDLRVTSSDPMPGDSVSYTVTVRGLIPGTGKVTTEMVSPDVPGTTVVTSTVEVQFRLGRWLRAE